MFGMTRREQRWKAEQELVDSILNFAAVVSKAEASARAEEAKAKARAEELEVEKLRLRVAELEKAIKEPNDGDKRHE